MTLKYNSLPRKTLAEPLTASSTSFRLNNIENWAGTDLAASDFGTVAYGVIRDAKGTKVEFFAFDPATIADADIDFTYRGLSFNGTDLTTEVSANKLEWGKGSIVELGTHGPQIFQWLQELIEGIAISGSPDATLIQKGLVELATAAQITAGTATGETGAGIAVTPDQLKLSEYGILTNSLTGVILPYGGASAPTGFLLCDGSAVSRTTYATLFGVISTTYGAGDGSTTFNVPDLRSSFPLGGGTARARAVVFDGASDVIPGNNQIAVPSGRDWLYTGTAVVLSGSSLPTGLSAGTYYIILDGPTYIKLASSVANANEGISVAITADGSGTCTLTQTLTARTIGATGGEESHALSNAEMPSHSHRIPAGGAGGSGGIDAANAVFTSYKWQSEATGSDTPHNTMPPYTVVNYIIKT